MPLKLLKTKFLINKKIIFFFLLLFLFFFIFFLLFNQFKIKEIKIESERKIDLQGLTFFRQKNLFFLNINEEREILLKNNPLIDDIIIKKAYPNKLILKIILEKPIIALKTNKGFFYLTQEGKVIEKREVAGYLPIINFYQTIYSDQYSLGKKINFNEIISAIYLINKIKKLGYSVNTIDIKGRNMILLKLNEKEIFFNLEKDLDNQIFQLKELLWQFKVKGEQFKSIDLRFKNPVVK